MSSLMKLDEVGRGNCQRFVARLVYMTGNAEKGYGEHNIWMQNCICEALIGGKAMCGGAFIASSPAAESPYLRTDTLE